MIDNFLNCIRARLVFACNRYYGIRGHRGLVVLGNNILDALRIIIRHVADLLDLLLDTCDASVELRNTCRRSSDAHVCRLPLPRRWKNTSI